MLRVILDVNVLVSGLLWDGPPATTYDLVVQNHALLISGTLLAELEHTLSRSRFASRIARRGTSVAALTSVLHDQSREGEQENEG